MKISGYVPFFNNAPTVLAAVESLRRQEPPLDEIFAVDDGSTDGGANLLEAEGVKVLRQPGNLGRGAARARAMSEAGNEIVVCCDATNVLAPDFGLRCAEWLRDPAVGAVVARIGQRPARNAVERWRGVHLFKERVKYGVQHGTVLSTYGAALRKSACETVGGFDPRLRHTEDADLGHRLAAAGFDIVMDPQARVTSIAENTLHQVLERYWRWYAGKDERFTLHGYLRTSWYSARTMALGDLARGDALSACISLYFPLFLLGKTLSRRARGTRQKTS